MNVIVDGRQAVLKEGASFEFVSENRLFLGRDGYTLNISFPLKDCPQNRGIFGHINRLDVAKENLTLDCSIVDGAVSLFGTLFVVKISEAEVECQFAEGRCAQTVKDPFEETSILDLELGSYPEVDYSAITPAQAWKGIDAEAEEVALPWINESSPTVPNNWVNYSDGSYSWDPENQIMSWQPYLIVIARRICEAIEYEYDFSEWWASNLRYLIICNTLPGAWEMPQYSKILPDWTVSEFFEKLELFLMCEFDFDHRAKSVKMRFSKDVIADIDPVKIDDVVDSYNVDLSREDDTKCDYLASKRLAFKSCSHKLANYYACDWYVQPCKSVKSYPTLAGLINSNKRRVTTTGGVTRVFWGEDGRGEIGATVNKLLYAEDVDTYFVFRSIGTEKIVNGSRTGYAQIYVLQPVNVFGSGSVEDDNTSTEEIEFVPPCIMDTYISEDDDNGCMMYLSPSGYDDSGASDSRADGDRPGNGGLGNGTAASSDPEEARQPGPASKISAGEKDKSSAFYDEIYVAFWNGSVPEYGKTPYPVIDGQSMISQSWVDIRQQGFSTFSMRISGKQTNTLLSQLPQIDPTQKFHFSWLSSNIPNPRAIFNIRGKRYLCEKITATFSSNGMSRLLKGEFYPLLENE